MNPAATKATTVAGVARALEAQVRAEGHPAFRMALVPGGGRMTGILEADGARYGITVQERGAGSGSRPLIDVRAVRGTSPCGRRREAEGAAALWIGASRSWRLYRRGMPAGSVARDLPLGCVLRLIRALDDDAWAEEPR